MLKQAHYMYTRPLLPLTRSHTVTKSSKLREPSLLLLKHRLLVRILNFLRAPLLRIDVLLYRVFALNVIAAILVSPYNRILINFFCWGDTNMAAMAFVI